MPTLDLTLTLSDREKEIYTYLCENLSNEEIAENLQMTESGVRYFLKSIYKKLGVEAKSKSDLHLCRIRAIQYGGTKIETIYQSKSMEFYSEEQLRDAATVLTWHSKVRVNEIISDLMAVLKKTL